MSDLIIGHHQLPQRGIQTPDGLLLVPRYVYRQKNRWLVRIKRQDEPELCDGFADSFYGGVVGSLSMAVESLYEHLPNYRTFDQLRPGSSHWYNVRERINKQGYVACQFVQTYICGFRGKIRTVCIYVGTPNTRSDKKLRLAIDQAIGVRQWSMDTIRREGRSVLYQLPVPKNVERFAV